MVKKQFKKISVVGLGYIGLPTAAVFAANGLSVNGVDINTNIVDTVNAGNVHIVEPGLKDLVESVTKNRSLIASTQVVESDAFIICVPTPYDHKTKSPDLSFIESAASSIAPALKKGDLVILESTSPVGTTEKLIAWLANLRPDLTYPSKSQARSDVRVAYFPERILPGNVLAELVQNDRIIGGVTEQCTEKAKTLYQTFVKGNCLTVSSPRVAELAKLVENSYRDVNIAFANELSKLSELLSVPLWELIEVANHHPRVNILKPGPGVGGHCIAVDPWFIVSSAPQESELIRTARGVNDSMPTWAARKVLDAVDELVSSGTHVDTKSIAIAFYGLSFKANIDDLRESPALEVVSEVERVHEGKILVVEPNISQLPRLGSALLIDMEKALTSADIHVLLVEHSQFYGTRPQTGVIIDFKGVWN